MLVACVTVLVAQSALIYPARTQQFAAAPTAPFGDVARGIGLTFNHYADVLGIGEASLLCPDVGGALYYSRLRVHDLGGLCDRRIARYLDQDHEGLRDYILEELRPTFINVHDSWALRTEFQFDARFQEAYVAIWETPCEWARQQGWPEGLFDGDYVRKDAIASVQRFEELRGRCGQGTQPLEAAALPRIPFPRSPSDPVAAGAWQ